MRREGGGRAPGGRVVLESAIEGRHAVVRVLGDHAGIAAEDLGRPFRPFGQVHDAGAVDAPKGTGLGRFICRGLVEAHGGRIGCESEGPGKGAVFAFTLPLAEAPTAAVPSRDNPLSPCGPALWRPPPGGAPWTPARPRRRRCWVTSRSCPTCCSSA